MVMAVVVMAVEVRLLFSSSIIGDTFEVNGDIMCPVVGCGEPRASDVPGESHGEGCDIGRPGSCCGDRGRAPVVVGDSGRPEVR